MTASWIVVIPTYNEALNIGPVLRRLAALEPVPDVLVVDDSSPDGTAGVVRATDYPANLELLQRDSPRGFGSAYHAGFEWALDRNYQFIAQLDADGSHEIEKLSTLFQLTEHFDMAVGSRFVQGGDVSAWSKSRVLLSQCGNVFARLVSGVRVRDITGGFRAYRAESLSRILSAGVRANGYAFQLESLLLAEALGLSIIEVPTKFVERRIGVSKMRPSHAAESLSRAISMGVHRRLRSHAFSR